MFSYVFPPYLSKACWRDTTLKRMASQSPTVSKEIQVKLLNLNKHKMTERYRKTISHAASTQNNQSHTFQYAILCND